MTSTCEIDDSVASTDGTGPLVWPEYLHTRVWQPCTGSAGVAREHLHCVALCGKLGDKSAPD